MTSGGGRADVLRASLLEAWRTVLGVDDVAADSNFFAAGGTSLGAAHLLALMRDKGFDARLADVISGPTFDEQLSAFTPEQEPSDSGRGQPFTIRQQLRLRIIAAQLRETGVATVKPVALLLELTGPVDHDAVADAMVDLVRRHAVLATGFVDRDGTISPVPTRIAERWRPERLDLTAAAPDDAFTRVREFIGAAARRGLTFDETPVVTGLVATVRFDLGLAAFVVDHLVCDAASLDVLFEDLAASYQDRVAGSVPDLSGPSSSPPDAAAAAGHARFDAWSQLATGWRDLLAGYPVPPAFDLLGDLGGRDYLATIPSPVTVASSRIPAATVRAAHRRLGLPPLSVVLGATYLAAHVMSGERDICIVNPQSRRHAAGAAHAVNDFTEPLIVRVRHAGEGCPCRMPLADVAALAHTSHADASALDMPFDMIMKAVKHPDEDLVVETAERPGRLAAQLHRAQVPDEVTPWLWCNYTASGLRSRSLGEGRATMLDTPVSGVVDVPNLEVYVEDDGDAIEITVVAPEKLYDGATVRALEGHLRDILTAYGDESRHGESLVGAGSQCRAAVEAGGDGAPAHLH